MSHYTRDESVALVEQMTRGYSLRHGCRYFDAMAPLSAERATLMAAGDILGVLKHQLDYCDILPPASEDPTLHKAVAKLKLEVEFGELAFRGFAAMTHEEQDRAIEILALLDQT